MLYPTRYGPILLCPLLNKVPYAWIGCHKSFRALASRNLARLVGTELTDIHAMAVVCNKTETAKAVHSDVAPNPITFPIKLGFVNRSKS